MDDETKTCSACGGRLEADASGAMPIQCPHCREILILDDEQELHGALSPGSDDELEAARIRRVVIARRALVRTRGYYLVGMGACLAIALQLFWRAYQMRSAPLIAAGYAAGGLLLVLIILELRRRTVALHEQMRTSALKDPATPPDFTPLSDGSQHARDLEQLGKPSPPPPPVPPTEDNQRSS